MCRVLTEGEKDYIRNNIKTHSMMEIAAFLAVKAYHVYQFCYRQKLIKPKPRLKREIIPMVRPDKKKPFVRPEPVYNNIPSPYMIATQLKEELSLICPGMSRMILR